MGLDVQHICMEQYDYCLPDERIAKYPLPQRDCSQLLVNKAGDYQTAHFYDLPDLLPANSCLVFNNTKVIQARLRFQKSSGAMVEVFCLEPFMPADYETAFQQTSSCQWTCLIGNLKKWKEPFLQKTVQTTDGPVELRVERLSSKGLSHQVRFSWDSTQLSFAELLDSAGELPIPPYLNRNTEEQDKETYQTVYSKIKGSVAAPTAGLHFTNQVLNRLDALGVPRTELTLHVGAGTFQPVKTKEIGGHEMHTEFIEVRQEALRQLCNQANFIVAVGTTSVRTLESLYYLGVRAATGQTPDFVAQWEPYQTQSSLSGAQALQALLAYMEQHQIMVMHASTQIIIVPGYRFRLVRGLITNFHQPKSTLLLLLAAFIGNDWKPMYQYALNHQYRFLSYGDACLLLPK